MGENEGIKMREREFKVWMRRNSNRFSMNTITHTLRYVKFIETQLELNLDEASVDEITDRIYELRESGKTVTTLNSWVKYLNRYLEFRGDEIKLKYFRHTQNDDLYFFVPTDEEKDAILAVTWVRPDVNARNRALLNLLFATGIRIGEAIALNWNDIELTNPSLPILHIRHGKGEKKRIVPLPPKVLKMLIDYKEKYRINSDPNAIFTTPHGRITHPFARKICKEAGELAGVPQFHAHAARHWRAIAWLKDGVNLETIRRFLGHSSLKTTQRYIRRLQMEWSFDEIREKDKRFGSWKPLGPEYLKKIRGEV